MKRALLLAALLAGLTACRHQNEPNKLIDGIPVNVSATVVPVQATQEYLLLKRDLLTVTIPVINKLVNADSSFSELTPVGGGVYTFTSTDGHYGTATFNIAFKDVNGGTIDPIAVRSSSNAVAAMTASVVGSSTLFSYSENLTLTLETSGLLSSTRRLSGTSNFTGAGGAAGYALTYSMSYATAIFQGMFAGSASATGSGGTPSQPAALTVNFFTDRSCSGTVQWEGHEGTYHVDVSGPAFVVTSGERLFIN